MCLVTDEVATIRVTNLSEDTKEADLSDLFKSFGPISRIFLAKDKNTNQSKVSLTNIFISKFVVFKSKKKTEGTRKWSGI